MNSKWAQSNKRNDEVMFPSRESVINYMNVMLRHKFFHRAKTIIVKKEIKRKQDTDSTDEGTKSETKKIKNVGEKSAKNAKEQSTTTSQEKTSKKEKKKVKLDMHMEQIFVDANEVNFLFSCLLVLICMKLNSIFFKSAICLDI